MIVKFTPRANFFNHPRGAEPRGVDWKSLPEGWIFQSLVTEEPMNRNHIYYPLTTILEVFSIIHSFWIRLKLILFHPLKICENAAVLRIIGICKWKTHVICLSTDYQNQEIIATWFGIKAKNSSKVFFTSKSCKLFSIYLIKRIWQDRSVVYQQS